MLSKNVRQTVRTIGASLERRLGWSVVSRAGETLMLYDAMDSLLSVVIFYLQILHGLLYRSQYFVDAAKVAGEWFLLDRCPFPGLIIRAAHHFALDQILLKLVQTPLNQPLLAALFLTQTLHLLIQIDDDWSQILIDLILYFLARSLQSCEVLLKVV